MGGGATPSGWQYIEFAFGDFCAGVHAAGELWYFERVLAVEEHTIRACSASAVIARTSL
jgi:hypothetical protein